MSQSLNRETFEAMYSGQPPWETGRPQPALVAIADQVSGSVLDVGCGSGENALFFARRSHQVLGVDFLEGPIEVARRKATTRGLQAEFACQDALSLPELDRQFETAIDSGLFHVFSDEDRPRYVASLGATIKPGGRLFLLCFSDDEPGTQGPRRVSQQEIRDAFADSWIVEEIRPTRFEVNSNLPNRTFSEGGPRAWLAVIRRQN